MRCAGNWHQIGRFCVSTNQAGGQSPLGLISAGDFFFTCTSKNLQVLLFSQTPVLSITSYLQTWVALAEKVCSILRAQQTHVNIPFRWQGQAFEDREEGQEGAG